MTDVTRSNAARSSRGPSSADLRYLVERELARRATLVEPAPVPNPARLTALDGRTFLDAVLAPSEEGVTFVIEALLARGVSAEAIYVELLGPTAYALGEMWVADTCDFVDVTVGLGRIQRALRSLSRVFLGGDADGKAASGKALLSCVPGEQHTLGLFLVAEFMMRDGWGVSLGPPVAEHDLLDLVRHDWFDVIGFSVACDTRLADLHRIIRKVRHASRNHDLGVMVGGRVFNERPELVARVGADISAPDARSASVHARQLSTRRGSLYGPEAAPQQQQ